MRGLKRLYIRQKIVKDGLGGVVDKTLWVTFPAIVNFDSYRLAHRRCLPDPYSRLMGQLERSQLFSEQSHETPSDWRLETFASSDRIVGNSTW